VKASDQWNFYQSKNLKQEIAINTDKILHVLGKKKIRAAEDHSTDIARYDKEKAEIKKEAQKRMNANPKLIWANMFRWPPR
jgi:hypothetical protein